MTPTPDSDLLILAMDHRDSLLRDLYRIDGTPTADQVATISAHKGLVFDGLLAAIDAGVDASRVGVLVDERYGSAVAVRAKASGIDLAMPIERSGEPLFLLEYGTFGDGEWLRHVDQFAPSQVKVLVRDNPEGAFNRTLQFDRLITVSQALRASGRTFLFELLVPATPAQLESVGSDALRYDTELRAGLTVRVIEEMQSEGIEPDIWKVEGLESVDDAASVVRAARRDGRTAVSCIVLGRDAPHERVDHWLEVASAVDGFRGFAIGRSIWEKPLADLVGGAASEAELVSRVAENYTHFARAWRR
ncbi:2-deoxy-5-keto-D-gluconate 6-phosphate aldolase domain-containing protein [Lacisediminihabitans sp. FW035]